MTEKELHKVVQNCKIHKRASQKLFYKHFYSYVMSIALRYTGSREEAEEILNDVFLKIFANMQHYREEFPIKVWLRKIAVNTAIDAYRKNEKIRWFSELPAEKIDLEKDTLMEIGANEILDFVQQLPPAYRTVFNLYVIEGYKHHEIADLLAINEGTSKSNLYKARAHLQRMIKNTNKETKISGYGG